MISENAVGVCVPRNIEESRIKKGHRPIGRCPFGVLATPAMYTLLAVLFASGCAREEPLAGKYSVRASGDMVAVFKLDSNNRYWMDGDSANVDSYFQSGDTVFLTFKNKGMPFVRRRDTLRYEATDSQFMQMVRIRD